MQSRPKDLALLTYLAVAGPFASERRDILLALFWPDLDTPHGRNALSQGLHRLRTSLPRGAFVVEGCDTVRVSAEQISCDAVSFEHHLEAGELADALTLYGGDFLAGFHAPGVAAEFQHWIAAERERLHRRAVNAILLLIQLEETSGTEQSAIPWLRRALDMRPYDESLCRRLMDALTAAGDRAGAIAQYERFARRLRDDYGLSPTAATRCIPDTIRRAEARAARPARSPETKVVESFLKGRYFTATIEQTPRGLQWLARTLELDPAFAPAHAATALSLANLAIMGHVPPAEGRARAGAAAPRAIELDPGLGDAHTAVGVSAMIFDWDWNRAEREFRAGTTLNPNSSDAHAFFAQFLCAIGKADEAVVEAEEAQRLDPLGLWPNFALAWSLFRARRHGDSIERFRSVLEVYPHFAYAHLFLAENFLSIAGFREAVESCRRVLDLAPEDQLLLGLTACVTGLSGQHDVARTLHGRLETLGRSRYVCPGHMAAAFLGLGERDRAFECWSAMYAARSALACLVPTDPLYDTVRDDRRFVELSSLLRVPGRDNLS